MNEETEVTAPQTVEETTSENQEVATPEVDESAKFQAIDAQKRHWREKALKAEADKKALEAELNKVAQQGTKPALDVEDYIDISASLDGLDQREKERLAREHKLTGKPLKEIREDEDFKLWQTAYKAKVEKEKLTLAPSSAQSESEKPRSFTERLKTASLAEKEKLLVEAGLYKPPKLRTDRTHIGGQR